MNDLLVRVQGGEQALPAVEWNRAEVAAWLEEKISCYRGRAYNPEDLKDAKRDRAEVNKIEKELAAAQKRIQELYKAPVNEFVAQMKEFHYMAQQVSDAIDVQIKRAEETQRDQRREQLRQTFAENVGDELGQLLTFDRLLDGRWLNKSVSASTAQRELLVKLESVRVSMEDLRAMCGEDFEEIQRVYLKNLSLNEAVCAYHQRQELRQAQTRAEAARKAAQQAAAAAPLVERPTPEQREIQQEGRALADADRCITPGGRLDIAEMNRQTEAASTFTRTLTVTYTAAQGRELLKFLRAAGIQYELT